MSLASAASRIQTAIRVASKPSPRIQKILGVRPKFGDRVAVVNSPGIFTQRKRLIVEYEEVPADLFCDVLRTEDIQSAIGHPGASQFIRAICGVDVPTNRTEIDIADYKYVVGIKLNFRPEPGREYTSDELKQFVKEGKIKFFLMRAYP